MILFITKPRIMKPILSPSLAVSLLLSLTPEVSAARQPVAPISAPQVSAINFYGGDNYVPSENEGFAGVSYAFNHNVYKSGFLIDVNNFIGSYHYTALKDSLQIASIGSFQGGMLSAGYHYVTPRFSVFNLLVGVELLNSQMSNSTDRCSVGKNMNPLNELSGCQRDILQTLGISNPRATNYGFEVMGNAYIPLSPKTYIYASGLYTVIWKNYNLLGKLGYWMTPKFSIGPQVSALNFSVIEGNAVSGVSPAAAASYYFTSNFSFAGSAGYYIDTSADSIRRNNGIAASVALTYNY